MIRRIRRKLKEMYFRVGHWLACQFDAQETTMAKPFDFMGMVNDFAGVIEKQAGVLRPRVVFGHYWDGKITKGQEELERLTDEQLKRLVIQGNLMISAAANVRQARSVAIPEDTNGVG